mmetsp:Transcript_30235/g.90681  ORF Transcript_30235/g.90681 Transcript_30235/m.90681 type:complete len:356 (-) Transcript_30235:298-1365(-)
MAPWAWMQRSTTIWTAPGTCALTSDSIWRVRPSRLPCTSIISAARYTKRRHISISARDLATSWRIVSNLASGFPNALRSCTRRTMCESARSALPISRMQWWMRPGPSLPWLISKPRPSPRRTLPTGTRTWSKRISMWPLGASSSPKASIGRTSVMPGVSIGTRIWDCWAYTGPSVLVFPIRIMILQCKLPAPVMYHFRPSITYSPRASSRRMLIPMLVASDEATSGSVIAKHDRIVPSRSGTSQRARCSSEPYRASTSMFPVSGEVQLVACAANSMCELVPRISHSSAYCRLVKPPPSDPPWSPAAAALSTGRNMFHSPIFLAFRLSCTRMGGHTHSLERRPISLHCSWYSCSFG